ncbi:MAG: aminotransferase class III-fold pyridoxal phosphate-dependent enzyme [Fimbriimonadaceae bacterium]|nr:aminotransferase class III-fold pyridoxal phosphate-dependent enzyme [Fimbriimonadaceae bacterium]
MGPRSKELWDRASQHLPGGVCSSTRLNQGLGFPVILDRGAGGRVWDVDGRELIDLCCGHGAALLGHGHPAIAAALTEASRRGQLCASETAYQGELAARLSELIPCAEMVRFTNSGSEATLHALRLCRGVTGRDKVIRVEGHFHGYHEGLYIGGHPPAERLASNARDPYIESAGIPASFAKLILPVPFNDLPAVERCLAAHAHEACCLILEPVNFNSGGLLPQPGYLARLRELCTASGVLLFFDEVQTSFKASPGGAQVDFGVTPDLCTIGKALGGGLPLSAICGRAELLGQFKPTGPVQHSGTFNAPLLNVLAALAFLDEITRPGFYGHLAALGDQLLGGLQAAATRHGVTLTAPRHGARFGLVFAPGPLRRYDDVLAHDRARFLAFVRACWERGVWFHDYGGSPCHHGWSAAHTAADIAAAVVAIDGALAAVAGG